MNSQANKQPQPEPELSLVEASQLVFLDPKKLLFSKHGAVLRLTIEADRSYLEVAVLRAFPLSEPKAFLSLRDSEEKEIGVITAPSDLDAANQRLVEEELARRYLTPDITSIVAVKARFGTLDWTVETSRGPRQFTTRNLRENVSRPTPGRIILTDVDGNSYDIRQIEELSPSSQALLSKHL